MLAMVGHPRDHPAFDRRRAEDSQHRTNHAPRLERPVGKQAVKADRHAETREHAQQQEVEDIVPAQQAVPQLPSNEEQAEDRDRGHDSRDHPVATLVDNRLNIAGPTACNSPVSRRERAHVRANCSSGHADRATFWRSGSGGYC